MGATEHAPAAPRREAAEHLARCSDCWAQVRLLHLLGTGQRPPRGDRMDELFGCDDVQDVLHVLVGLERDALLANHPAALAHLGWCLACRDRFVEVLAAERLAGAGAFDAPPAGWRAVEVAGRLVRELIAPLGAVIRAGVPVFAALPAGVIGQTAPAPAGMRGATAAPTGVQGVRLALDRPALVLELHPRGTDRTDLALVLSSAADAPTGVRLLASAGGREELVASATLGATEPLRIRALARGRYVLELAPPADAVLRVTLDVAVD
jgi:hypothetical protein